MVFAHAYLWCAGQSLAARLSPPRRGQGLVEYSLIIAVVAVAAIVGLTFMGGHISATLSNIVNHLNLPVSGTPYACTPLPGNTTC